MNILVAGGAGFIGSNLCASLIKDGHKVVILDNLSTGSLANIRDLEYGTYTFVNEDVRTCDLGGIISIAIDVIINLACIASPKAYYKQPVDTLMTSVLGTKNLLDYALTQNAMLIQASTSEIYGDPNVDILEETYNGNVSCTGPRACYDEGKRAAETLCMDYIRTHKMDVRIIRIFNTYGPKMNSADGRAIPEFINKALKSESIEIYGSGDQTRSFMFIDDLIKAVKQLIKSDVHFDTPINIGNPYEEHTINELAGIIKTLTHSDVPVVHLSGLEDDPRKRKPSILKAERVISWKPTVSLKDGLCKTIQYFRQND